MRCDRDVGADILACHQHQPVAQKIFARVVLDQALVVEIVHPVQVGRDEDVRAARRLDLARQDRRRGQRYRHLLAALFFVERGNVLQGIGKRGRAEHRDIGGKGRQRRQRQQQGSGQGAQKFRHRDPLSIVIARSNITIPDKCKTLARAVLLRVRMRRMAGLFLRLPIGDAGNLGPGKARLLELIEETGAIRAAASKMKLSYRRALVAAAGYAKDFRRRCAGTAHRRQGGRRRRAHQSWPRHRPAFPQCRAPRGPGHQGGPRRTGETEELSRRHTFRLTITRPRPAITEITPAAVGIHTV